MNKLYSILPLLVMSFFVLAQDNLVPNPDFQTLEKKVKEEGQITLATPWKSPTLAPADLYTKSTKNGLVGTPENAYGEEKPMVGDNYAGFLAYSEKNKEPRSYLQVQLTEQLEEGKSYCVTIYVSLADLSKYATNYIGMAITKNAISANNSDILKVENQIVSKKLSKYDQQFYWTPICGVFKAKGGEEFLTIGNFTPDEKLALLKVKRPRGVTKPQLPDAYYFVDNVSVIETSTPNQCDCDSDPAMRNTEVVNRNFSSDKNPAANKIEIIGSDGNPTNTSTSKTPSNIDNMTISFVAKSFSIDDNVKKINEIIAYLKANPKVKITLIGHIDKSEKEIDKLDGKRVGAVYKYIVSKGIKADRLNREIKSDEEPVDAKDPMKNMRVEIIEEVGLD
ncbi:MAG: hypothetical protein CVT95_06340 [Bacteroidetes bacterium HGW-Bacteroidetes-12]|nr:MAG: hypothetical protein CVT95_06340 [Bacteroidetes bacterium HGW-Bacteroidetes-12]